MIFYATKETMQRYKLKTPEQLQSEAAPLVRMMAQKERGNHLYEWGCKLLYFDGRKCLQVMHFETKLVVFLMDLKQKDLEFAGDAVANYLMDMYAEDKEMIHALEQYCASSPIMYFDKITDKSIIASMNHVQMSWAMDGYRFWDFIWDGILHTRIANREVNDMPCTKTVNAQKEWIIPYERFAQVMKGVLGQPAPVVEDKKRYH